MTIPSHQKYLSDIRAVFDAIAASDLQTLGLTPHNSHHNTRAALLRKGLYVVTFNAMENFLKSRVSLHLGSIRHTALTFNELPPKLQGSAVEETIKSAIKQASFDRQNSRSILQDAATAVASTTATTQYVIHRFSLLHSNSNISVDDITNATGALHIRDPWSQMQQVLTQAGIGGLPIQEQYKSALSKRNTSAHSDISIERTDLEGLVTLAVQVGCAFDIVFAAGVARILNNIPTFATESKIDILTSVALSFIDQTPKGWARLDRNGRPARYFADLNSATRSIFASRLSPDVVVARSSPLGIAGWSFSDTRVPA